MIEQTERLFGHLIHFIEHFAGWIIAGSAAFFVLSILFIRFVLIRVPSDYFLVHQPLLDRSKHPVLAVISFVGRNLAGFLFLVLGLVMSLPGVPGQGALTILIGLSIMNFPGKRRIELSILRQRIVLNTINSIRAKGGQLPLELPGTGEAV